MAPIPHPSSWAPSALLPVQKPGKAVSPRLPIGAEADGVPIPGTLSRRDRLSVPHRVPLCYNPHGIGDRTNASRWLPGLDPSSPAHLYRPHGNGRLHRHLEPFEMGFPASFSASPPFQSGEGQRSRPPLHFPSPGSWDPGNGGGRHGIEMGPISVL